MSVQILRRRFTVEEYYRMAEAGILMDSWTPCPPCPNDSLPRIF